MSNQEAFYIVGNMPIPTEDNNYDICQYQEAKAIALDCIQKIDDIKDILKSAIPTVYGREKTIDKILELLG